MLSESVSPSGRAGFREEAFLVECVLMCMYQVFLTSFVFLDQVGCVSHSVVSNSFCDPMDCTPPGFSVHGISHARTLEWVAIPFSRGSSRPRHQTQVSCIAGRFFTAWATREAQNVHCEPARSQTWNLLIRPQSDALLVALLDKYGSFFFLRIFF